MADLLGTGEDLVGTIPHHAVVTQYVSGQYVTYSLFVPEVMGHAEALLLRRLARPYSLPRIDRGGDTTME
jgi:hypothetical protein